jgi:hypothetical protein
MFLGEAANFLGIDRGILKLALKILKSSLNLFEFPKHAWILELKRLSVSLLSGLGGFRVLIFEALKTAFGIHHLMGAGIKGVASRADIHAKILYRAGDFNNISTVACSGGVGKLWVNAFFHKNLVYYKSLAASWDAT